VRSFRVGRSRNAVEHNDGKESGGALCVSLQGGRLGGEHRVETIAFLADGDNRAGIVDVATQLHCD
jgi:hypothetical protein